jgi:hypothetical protein
MRYPLILALVGLLNLASVASAQQMHRNAFESRTTYWKRGKSDAPHKEIVQEITAQSSHSGKQSEHIQVQAEQGTNIYYYYPVGKADLLDALMLSVWVKANRPGAQLSVRVVLPRERTPENLDQPTTTLLRGDTYTQAGRWQKLEIRYPTKQFQQQQPLIRAELKRDLNFEGAYIDQIVLNVYGGKGINDLWIDDLEIGPILGDGPGPTDRPSDRPPGQLTSSNPPAGPAPTPRANKVELNRNKLLVNGQPILVRAIRYSNTPLKTLRDAGFNALWVEHDTKEEVLAEAARLGFLLIPEMPVLQQNERLAIPAGLTRELSRYPQNDSVLFWHTGNGLTAEQAEFLGKASQVIRTTDGRPVAADIWDGFRPYSRHLDIVGTHRWPLYTGLELVQYREWLHQRVRLADPGIYLWTWVQTHLPDWYTNLVYNRTGQQDFDEPIGPQPEQIRLLTYLSLSAGFRGLGFWSDRFLANSHMGKGRLLQLALLNQEFEMIEPLLAGSKDISWIASKHPDIRAAVMRHEKGLLVLVMALGSGSQFVPAQLAAANLELVIPGAPEDAQVWEVSPGDVRALKRERVAGGIKVVIPEFGLTSMLVLTSDINLIGSLQQHTRQTRQLAAQWSYDLAVGELKKVQAVNDELEKLGVGQPDGRALLDESAKRLTSALEAYNRKTQADYREAYREAQRALRPLRILMRAHWDKANKLLDFPVSTPYSVCFYTLPRYWEMVDQIRKGKPERSVLPNGGFEAAVESGESWTLQSESLDDVLLLANRVSDQPKEGQECLVLDVRPKNPQAIPVALERTFLAVSSRPVAVQPGSLVRISAWVRIPKPIVGSADGVLFFDNIAGEPLAVRLTGTTPWRKITLYRRVPDSGQVVVTAAMTGMGTAFFDDIRIEPLGK